MDKKTLAAVFLVFAPMLLAGCLLPGQSQEPSVSPSLIANDLESEMFDADLDEAPAENQTVFAQLNLQKSQLAPKPTAIPTLSARDVDEDSEETSSEAFEAGPVFPTPQPTPSPGATEVPSATPLPQDEATIETNPSEEDEESESDEDAEIEISTPTPGPSTTPLPIATPSPTPTPQPLPSVEPEPTEEPEPTDEPGPTAIPSPSVSPTATPSAPLPDLRVKNARYLGGSKFSIEIENRGTSQVPSGQSFSVEIIIPQSASDAEQEVFGPLAPGAARTIILSEVFVDQEIEHQDVRARADSYDEIQESNEANNALITTFQVPKPTITPKPTEGPTPKPTATPRPRTQFTISLANNGNDDKWVAFSIPTTNRVPAGCTSGTCSSYGFAEVISTNCKFKGNAPELKAFDNAKKTYHYVRQSDGSATLRAGAILPSRTFIKTKISSPCAITFNIRNPVAMAFTRLYAGKNRVAGPMNPVDFDEIKGDCELVGGIKEYKNSRGEYASTSTLEPGKAYLLKVEKDCKLGARAPTAASPSFARQSANSASLSARITNPNGREMTARLYARKKSENFFTIAIMPDTQKYSASYPETFNEQTKWIARNAGEENIAMAIQLGDIVDDPQCGPQLDERSFREKWGSDNLRREGRCGENLDNQWRRAKNAINNLEGKVPYALIPGNHDFLAYSRASENYPEKMAYLVFDEFWSDKYFSIKQQKQNSKRKLAGYKYDSRNTYHLFTAGTQKYILITLEYCPNRAIIDWAKKILGKYSDRKAILATHSFLDRDGDLIKKDRSDYNYCHPRFGDEFRGNEPSGRESTKGEQYGGAEIFDELVAETPNIFLVLSGHEIRTAKNNDWLGGTFLKKLVNKGTPKEREVSVALSNYQSLSHGGNGYLRLMKFYPNQDKIEVETYSPTLGRYLANEAGADCRKDLLVNRINRASLCNQFTITHEMPGYLKATRESVPSGSTVTFKLSNLAPGEYEWYIEADNGQYKTKTPTREFTIS